MKTTTTAPYAVAPERLGLAAYRLLTHILGSRALASLCTGHFACGFDILRDNFEATEIQHLLLELAVSYRVRSDTAQGRVFADAHKSLRVGTLRQPKAAKAKPLSMRQACNKIIHAQGIRLLRRAVKGEPHRARIDRTVELVGVHGKQEWRARLDMIAFCEHVAPPED